MTSDSRITWRPSSHPRSTRAKALLILVAIAYEATVSTNHREFGGVNDYISIAHWIWALPLVAVATAIFSGCSSSHIAWSHWLISLLGAPV